MKIECAMVEVEEFQWDNHIHVHIAEGFEKKGNMKYTNFVNL